MVGVRVPEGIPVQEEIRWSDEMEHTYQPGRRSLAEFLTTIAPVSPVVPQTVSPTVFPAVFPKTPLLVFIKESCQETMLDHGRQNPFREQAGILCGNAYEDAGGRYFVNLTSVLAADTHGDATHFKFDRSSWEGVWAGMTKDENVLGWYHSHPGIGIFLSATDLRTQRSYFCAPWQIAMVIDPQSEKVGVFAGRDGERLPAEQYCGYREREPILTASEIALLS